MFSFIDFQNFTDIFLSFVMFSIHNSVAKVVATTLVAVGGGIGGTVLYAKWDHKFRAAVENSVPYSELLFDLALGPTSQDGNVLIKKQVRMGSQLLFFLFFLNWVSKDDS